MIQNKVLSWILPLLPQGNTTCEPAFKTNNHMANDPAKIDVAISTNYRGGRETFPGELSPPPRKKLGPHRAPAPPWQSENSTAIDVARFAPSDHVKETPLFGKKKMRKRIAPSVICKSWEIRSFTQNHNRYLQRTLGRCSKQGSTTTYSCP